MICVSTQSKNPQEILRKIQMMENQKKYGKLKIFFGYAAGVGKTYAMLKAAHEAKNEGKDVVVGYVERHIRPDTLALLEGLEQIPCKEIIYKGVKLKEFDLDAALNRKPQLILVDELAHSNAAGARHTKRYQDIEELLHAGIDVYTTVNVQHIESLNDLVSSITGIAVNERVPDHIFDSADQIKLIDIEPEELLSRLQAGKVYNNTQAARALNNFFSLENLAALREIALRRTADRLNHSAQEKGNESAAKAGEHILICLSSSPSNPKVIRTAARMAEAFHSSFTALFVETPETKELKGDNLKRLHDNLHLAEQLGAQIATAYGEDPAVQIAQYAKASGITKIVLGKNNQKQSLIFKKATLADKLIKLTDTIDVYIIPDNLPLYKKKNSFFKIDKPIFNKKDFLKTLLITFLCTVTGFIFFKTGFSYANIITVYILGVLATSVWTQGYLYGAIASFISVFSFNFFFTEPRFSFQAIEPDYPVTFLIMLAAGIITSTLAMRVKKQAKMSAQKAYSTELLLSATQKLQAGKTEDEIIEIYANQINKILERPILYSLVKNKEKLSFNVAPKDEINVIKQLTKEEIGVADWVVRNNKRAGASTTTLSNAQNLYLSIGGLKGVMGVIGIPIRKHAELGVFEKNITFALTNECGLILERFRFQEEKRIIETQTEKERIRANMLRAISHDLRTPLTSISGNAGMLMNDKISLDEEKKHELYRTIYDDSVWLVNLTENLLSITRIEDGSMNLHTSAELIDDVFREALSHIDRNAKDHNISVELSDEFLMAKMDVQLVVQLIVNIVNNAIKYTPVGSNIKLKAKKEQDAVCISISDDGPGISDDAKKHLFDMFYTVSQGKADSRRGLGLGLSLCKSIASIHGGDLTVSDNQPNGSIFTFTLPIERLNDGM